jgi:AcrR family transcriptional regulator
MASERSAVVPRSGRAEEILRCATALFAADGYQGVGMRAIAAAVGIRTPSLYHHFASKEEILYAISLRVTKDFIDERLPVLEGPGTPAQRLTACVRSHVVFFSEHRLEELVGRRSMQQLAPEHHAEVRSWLRRYQRAINATLRDGVRRGDFEVADPEVTTVALLDMINGINSWYRPDGRLSIDQLADTYAELVVNHLLRRPA